MKVHDDDVQEKGTTAAAKRPNAVPPGVVSWIVYFAYAAIGLYFAVHNSELIVRQMAAPEEAPGFAAATLFFCMSLIPTVILLYLTASMKVALIDKLGVTTAFVIGGMIVLFGLMLWVVLIASQADVRATIVGLFIPMVVRVTFQNPGETIKEANQRIVVYFAGALIGVFFLWIVSKIIGHDLPVDRGSFAFSSVVLLPQLLGIYHLSLQVGAMLRWHRQDTV